jgi:hypothetical protein
MTLSDLASIGSLVSGAAVLGSLIYLALQVRQADRNQRALIRHSRVTRGVEIQLARADPGLADAFRRGVQNLDEITQTEVIQFLAQCRAQFLHLEDGFYRHEEGLLNEDAFATTLAGARGFTRIPSARVAWKNYVRAGHAGRFRDFMDDIVARASLEPAGGPPSVDEWKAAYAAETSSG